MKKFALTAAMIVTSAGSAFANAPTVTLSGVVDNKYGYVDQKSGFRYATPDNTSTSKLRNHALVSETKVKVRVDGKMDRGLGYGAMVLLNADTSADKDGDSDNARQTMAYVEGMFGRVEAGSYTGASYALQTNAMQIARGNGCGGETRYWINQLAGSGNSIREDFLLVPTLYTNNAGLISSKQVNAAKLTYYTPKVGGLEAGITYIDDLESYGTINQASSALQKDGASLGAMRNIIEGGLRYSAKMDKVTLKASLLGQHGLAKHYGPNGNRALRAWEAGASVGYMNITIAGAYGSLEKSGQTKITPDRTSQYWNAGAAVENGPFGLSVVYTETKRGINNQAHANRMRNVTAGADYVVAKGMKVYGNTSYFRFHDKGGNTNNKGMTYILGSELAF
ncbi:MAG: porin [Proteobacteria bacterium]|nr:porin [Pseudomonadota bacterium]